MKRKKLALVAVSLALGFGAAAGAARSGLLGTLAIGEKGHPAASGIQVHGKWSLVVRNRRGKVVARRRFENALTPQGADILVGLIAETSFFPGAGNTWGGYGSIGGQGIQLDDGSAPGHGCNLLFPIVNPCVIEHSNGAGASALSVVAAPSGITLSGNVAPAATTTFTKVETLLKTCTSDHGQDDCNDKQSSDAGVAWRTFTSKTLTTPLPVQAGQAVSVTVTLSFS